MGTQIYPDMTPSDELPPGSFVPFVPVEGAGDLSSGINYRYDLGQREADVDDALDGRPTFATLALDSGAGLIGTDSGLTVQESLDAVVASVGSLPQAQPFQRKMRAAQTDCRVLHLCDSTAQFLEDRWPALLLPYWAAEFPAYTIKYRLMSGSGVWAAYVTYATGTGDFTLWLDISTLSGEKPEFHEGAQQPISFVDGASTDLVLICMGDNYGTDIPQDTMYLESWKFVADIADLCPNAGIVTVYQNPRREPAGTDGAISSGQEFSERLMAAWSQVVGQQGIGYANVYDAFLNNPAYPIPAGDPGSLYDDYTHPSALGSEIYRSVIWAAIAFDASSTVSLQSASPWRQVRQNFMPNPNFALFDGDTPTSAILINCTVDKDPGRVEQGLYALKFTIAGANARMRVDLSGPSILNITKGKKLYLIARPYKPSGFVGGEDLPSRITLTCSNGAVSHSGLSYNYLDGDDGYRYVITEMDVLPDATSMSATFYVGPTSTADNGMNMWLNYWGLFIGQPGALDFDALPTGEITEFYSAANVGPVALLNDGVVTAVGDEITVTGATGGAAEIYIDMPPLTTGTQYRLTFTVDTITTSGTPGGGVIYFQGVGGYGTPFDSGTTWAQSVEYVHDFIVPDGPITIRVYPYTGASAWHGTFAISQVKVPDPVFLTLARNSDGSVVDATGGAGKFSISSTPGTSLSLLGESTQNTTKTDVALIEAQLPSDYVDGTDASVIVNANYSGTGTAGTKTIQAKVYKIATDGTQGSNLGSAAQTMTTSAADYAFVIDGSGLEAKDRLLLDITAILQETGNLNPLVAHVGSVGIVAQVN